MALKKKLEAKNCRKFVIAKSTVCAFLADNEFEEIVFSRCLRSMAFVDELCYTLLCK